MAAKVLVPIADGFEEIETVTVVDMLRRAELDVVLAGLEDRVLLGSRKIKIQPDMTFAKALEQNFDMIVLPGGQPGVNHLKADSRVLQLLKKMQAENKWIAAICAAPLILKEAGLIDQRKLTSFPGVRGDLTGCKYDESRVVVDGRLITSRGPGTAMEFALKLIEILCGTEKSALLADTVVSALTMKG